MFGIFASCDRIDLAREMLQRDRVLSLVFVIPAFPAYTDESRNDNIMRSLSALDYLESESSVTHSPFLHYYLFHPYYKAH